MSTANPLMHHHPLIEEFAEQRDTMHALKLESAHFRHLMQQYEGLDKEISRIDSGIEAHSDAYTRLLKNDRLFLKDQIAAALNRHPSRL